MVVGDQAFAYINNIYLWINENAINLVSTTLVIIVILIVYRFLAKEINKLIEKEIVDQNTAFLFIRITKWTVYIIFGVLIFNTLGIKIDFFLGLWVLAGGTIIGFASMNTFGNAIAGLIIMVSRPFKISDRLYFQEQYVVVEDIDLIYTRMRTLDNVAISVPNQIILGTVISNQSAYHVVRKNVVITVDYAEKPDKIRDLLLSAISEVEEVLTDPKPYVWVTAFPNAAMEYTIFYFISDTIKVQKIYAEIYEAIYNELSANGIDLSTPSLVKSIR